MEITQDFEKALMLRTQYNIYDNNDTVPLSQKIATPKNGGGLKIAPLIKGSFASAA